MALVQQRAHHRPALVVLERRGNAQEAGALAREHGGHGAGGAGEAVQAHAVIGERLAAQRLVQAVGQELDALALLLVAGLDETAQHGDALLHFALQLLVHGARHAPGDGRDQHGEDGGDPHEVGDRQLGTQTLSAPETLTDVHALLSWRGTEERLQPAVTSVVKCIQALRKST